MKRQYQRLIDIDLIDNPCLKLLFFDTVSYFGLIVKNIVDAVIVDAGGRPEKISLKKPKILTKSFLEELEGLLSKPNGIIGKDIDRNIKLDGTIIKDKNGNISGFKMQKLSKQIKKYLNSMFKGLGNNIATQALIISKIYSAMEQTQATKGEVKETFLEKHDINTKNVLDKYEIIGKDYQNNRVFYNRDLYQEQAKESVRGRIDGFLTDMVGSDRRTTSKVEDMVVKQVQYAIDKGLNAQQLSSNMYHSTKQMRKDGVVGYNDLYRDWRRVAKTELNRAYNEGYLASFEDRASEEPVYMVYSGNYNPKEKPNEVCNVFLGEVCRLIPSNIASASDDAKAYFSDEKTAKRVTWSGKDRYNRGKEDVWISAPSHPNCTHKWVYINPEYQKYSKKFGRPVVKSFITKSKSLPIGSIRTHGNVKVQKQPTGKWTPVPVKEREVREKTILSHEDKIKGKKFLSFLKREGFEFGYKNKRRVAVYGIGENEFQEKKKEFFRQIKERKEKHREMLKNTRNEVEKSIKSMFPKINNNIITEMLDLGMQENKLSKM